ncbi:MAG: sensor histidine kinase, partial [Ilumatobacter sp.]
TTFVERHLMGDVVTTSVGVVVASIAAIAFGLNEWWAWYLIGSLLVMGLVRGSAIRPLRAGRRTAAVARIALGSWGIALAVVVVAPSFLPVLAITIAIPPVVAALQLERRAVAVTAGCMVLVTLVVGSIGMWTSGVDLEEEIGESWRNLFVVLYLAGQFVPLVQLVWQTSDLQRTALDRERTLNAELRRSDDRLRASRSRLVESADQERRRLERDLHDGAQQAFVSTLLQMRIAARAAERGRAIDSADVDALADDLETGIDQLRSLAHGIFPPLLEARGVFEAVRSLATTTGLRVEVTGADPGRMTPSHEVAFYLGVSEALQNITKHAGTGVAVIVKFDVETDAEHEWLTVSVVDDGVGAEPDELLAGRVGVNLADRLGAVGGTVDFDASPGAGCSVEMTAPIVRRSDVVSAAGPPQSVAGAT